MSKKEDEIARQQKEESEIRRIMVPRGTQVYGVVETRLGASRMRVRCLDGKTRICRIPGRLKRQLWVRENDLVVIEPWEHGGEDKGDVIYKYTPTQVGYLRRKGLLKELVAAEEF